MKNEESEFSKKSIQNKNKHCKNFLPLLQPWRITDSKWSAIIPFKYYTLVFVLIINLLAHDNIDYSAF